MPSLNILAKMTPRVPSTYTQNTTAVVGMAKKKKANRTANGKLSTELEPENLKKDEGRATREV